MMRKQLSWRRSNRALSSLFLLSSFAYFYGFFFGQIYCTDFSASHYLDMLSGFNDASQGVHIIAEEVECEQELARNSLAHNRMCRGNGVKEPPQFLLQGAIGSIVEDNRCYPHPAGFSPMRKIVLEFIEMKFGIKGLTIDNLCPSHGVSDGFTKTVALLLKNNDVVVSFAPTFGLHSRVVNSFGGQVIPIDVLDTEKGVPSIEELEEHIVNINNNFKYQMKNAEVTHIPRVKLLNLINPSNPLGKVITDTADNREYYRNIYFLAEKYHFMIFDDLVYWGTEHDPKKRAMPFLTAVPEAKDRVIMAFGPSKSLGGAGMRAGMLVAPEWFIKEVRKVILNVNSGISAFSQYLMAAAFNMNYEMERELFLQKNAQEYALRRDVCMVGLIGEKAALIDSQYGISPERMKEVKLFVRLVAYARLLIHEYDANGIPEHIQEAFTWYETIRSEIGAALEKEEWFKMQSSPAQAIIIRDKIHELMRKTQFPHELYVISYVFYQELKNKSTLVIPKEIISCLDSVHLSEKLRLLEIPEVYKERVDSYLQTFLKGTRYLKVYSIPEATFFITIDASEMIGKYAPIDIIKKAHSRVKKIKKGEKVPQGKNIIKLSLNTINPTPITSSREIDLLFSWLGGHNYISGELMNVAPNRGMLRMTYAEPPVIFLDAIDSMRHIENYIKPSQLIGMWVDNL